MQAALASFAVLRPNKFMTKPDLDSAYALKTPEDNLRLYADWAETYDNSFAKDMDYQLPAHVARVFVENGGAGPVLDLGAGTGLCAQALNGEGVSQIDGTDISAEMLEVAKTKGIYRALFTGDLLDRLPVAEDTYAGLVSSGTFTNGHVGPGALDEVLRIAAPGALIALSINAQHWQEQGFKAKFDDLSDKIADLALTEVAIYGDRNTSDHRDDIGLIVCFQAI